MSTTGMLLQPAKTTRQVQLEAKISPSDIKSLPSAEKHNIDPMEELDLLLKEQSRRKKA